MVVVKLPGMTLDEDLLLDALFSSPPPGAAVFLSSFLTGLPLTLSEGHTGINTSCTDYTI